MIAEPTPTQETEVAQWLDRVHCGDCLPWLRSLPDGCVDAVVTDPPYPNNAGHFSDQVDLAREVLANLRVQTALIFWSELECPPVPLPLVAVHIFHRTNVNGRPYEPIYHFEADGRKRRSEVKAYWHIKPGIGPAAKEYAGHPTQKPIALMAWCLERAKVPPGGTVLDPFLGSGTTAVACVNTGRHFIGAEIDAGYCAIAERRIADARRAHQPALALQEQP